MGRWHESDKIAVAAGEATSRLLARNAIIQTETFHDKLTRIEQTATARAVGLADAARTIDGLRNELDQRAAATMSQEHELTGPTTPNPPQPCGVFL